jgi:hypothetical protein
MLIAVDFTNDDRQRHNWLRSWNVTDGRPTRPAAEIDLRNFTGGLLPGPDSESLISANDTRNSPETPAGQVLDRSSGTPIIDLPYVPVRWVSPGRLLALSRPNYNWGIPVERRRRDLFIAAFDQKQYLAKAGDARGASALRPAATPGDRKAVKALRPEPAGWAVPADPAPPGPAVKSAAVQIEQGDVLFAPQAGQVSCVFTRTAIKPVWRLSLNWSRYDLRTGKPLGDPVELWPWTKREDKATEPPGSNPLPPSLSGDGRRLVLRDPAHVTWGRVDVWEADAGRVLGLLPYGGPMVEWHGWAADGRLLTVGDGKLTAWDVPAGRAVFEVAGKYAGRAALSPGRAWVVVPAVGHLDVLDTATGACLGRLDNGGVPPRAWSRLAVSPDGRRLVALKWAPQQPRAVHTWDLDSGKARESIPMPPGGGWLLHWYGERHVLAGGDLVDLELHTAVATYTLPGSLAELAEGPVDGRLWCVSVPKPAAPAQPLMSVAPPEDGPARGALVACLAPDPAVVEVLPAAPPADPAVVFHPGMEVALDVDCGDPGRTARATAAMTDILRRDRFKVGPGSGWKIVVKGEQYDIRLPLAPGEDASAVPAVRGRVTLHAPDGTVVGGEEHRSDIARLRSKYERRASRDDPPGSRRYDFEGRSPREALAEEYWDAWMTSLDKPKWPRALMRYQGRYAPLPAVVTLDPVPLGS